MFKLALMRPNEVRPVLSLSKGGNDGYGWQFVALLSSQQYRLQRTKSNRRSREGGNPVSFGASHWIPAFAGMTVSMRKMA